MCEELKIVCFPKLVNTPLLIGFLISFLSSYGYHQSQLQFILNLMITKFKLSQNTLFQSHIYCVCVCVWYYHKKSLLGQVWDPVVKMRTNMTMPWFQSLIMKILWGSGDGSHYWVLQPTWKNWTEFSGLAVSAQFWLPWAFGGVNK